LIDFYTNSTIVSINLQIKDTYIFNDGSSKIDLKNYEDNLSKKINSVF